MSTNSFDPDIDCQLCPRLVNYRGKNRARYPHWHNGPVSSFGSFSSNLLIVGLRMTCLFNFPNLIFGIY